METELIYRFNNRSFEIVSGHNQSENTEYLQLNETGQWKPKPIMFFVRTIPEGDVTVSMHYEGLPREVFSWFINNVHAHWNLLGFD